MGERCVSCGRIHNVMPSNNKLVKDICNNCLLKVIDYRNLEDANYFCRTYNYPFNPDLWIKMTRIYGAEAAIEYVNYYRQEDSEYEINGADLWHKLNEEWALIQAHEELIAKVETVKKGFEERNKIKWTGSYSFEELIALENLYINTLKANNISNPMQKDAIKKACKMSIQLDRAIVEGDSKEINELSKAYQNFVKTAKIEDLITASSNDVISNVAQLVQYIEEQGFEFKYYDNVDRDVVDKSLKIMQQFVQRLFLDETGLEHVFETISSSLQKEEAIKKDAESYEKVPLEELYSKINEDQSKEFDEELEKQDIMDEDDEDEFF